MGSDSTNDADDKTKDDATKDANAGSGSDKDAEGHDGKDSKDDKSKEDPTAGLKSALQKERAERAKLEKTLREAELAKLPELERFKTENAQLAKENETLKTTNMRQQIALELELPWRLAKRISGDTEDEMRSDAADLLKDFKRDESGKDDSADKDKTNKKPPTNDGRKSGGTGAKDMNFLLRRAAGRA